MPFPRLAAEGLRPAERRRHRVSCAVLKRLRNKRRRAAASVELARRGRRARSTFAAPRWLRDLGRTAWLLVGLFALLVGVWLLGETYTIVGPVVRSHDRGSGRVTARQPLARHMPRAAATALVVLGVVAVAVGCGCS